MARKCMKKGCNNDAEEGCLLCLGCAKSLGGSEIRLSGIDWEFDEDYLVRFNISDPIDKVHQEIAKAEASGDKKKEDWDGRG